MNNCEINQLLLQLKGIVSELQEQEPEKYKLVQSYIKKFNKVNDNSEEAKIAFSMTYFEMMSKEEL